MRRTFPIPSPYRRHRSIAAVSLSAVVASLAACASPDSPSARGIGPTAPATSVVSAADASLNRRNVAVHWNEVARALVASHNTNGPLASRVYALVSVAQIAAAGASPDGDRGERAHADDELHGVAIDVAIARASANLLAGLYPDASSAAVIAAALNDDQLPHGQSDHGGPGAGDAAGARVAHAVLAHAAADGAAAANCPATPPTPATQFWHDDAVPPNPQPVLPCFGQVRTWLALTVPAFRADPPPAFGSPAFLAGVAEVRHISDTRTAAQLAIVDKWLDGNNTFQPPGRWNLIASDLVTQHHLDAAAAARVFAVLNVAMMDTHVVCWDRKYTFWELRPWMADPLITTPRGQPHHPGNPSGHACAGGAGSGTLAALFPAERDSLLALGNEQGFSTVLAGTHFQFDVDKGLQIGRTIAATALSSRALADVIARL